MTISDAAEASLLLAKQRTTYHVTVYTGDLFGAGTDSDVMLQLFGATEDSGENLFFANLLFFKDYLVLISFRCNVLK